MPCRFLLMALAGVLAVSSTGFAADAVTDRIGALTKGFAGSVVLIWAISQVVQSALGAAQP